MADRNIFDQFDTVADAPIGNIFDQFDAEIEHSKDQFHGNYEQRARAEAADNRVALERAQQGPLKTGARDVLRNIATGTPVGSWLDEANSGLSDVANRVTGGRFGEPYQDRMDYQAAYDRATDRDSTRLGFDVPTLDGWQPATAGGIQKIAGGVMSMGAMPAGALNAMISRPAISGAVMGAGYGAGQGQGFAERGQNAMLGFVTGGVTGKAAPYIAKGTGNVVGYVGDRLRPLPFQVSQYAKPAVNKVLAAFDESGLLDPATYRAKVGELGEEGLFADMSQRLTDQAGALASLPGRSKNIVTDAIETRAAGAPKRIEDTTNATMGPQRNLVAERDRILAQTRADADPDYQRFYSTPVPMTNKLQAVLERVPASIIRDAEELAKVRRDYQMHLSKTGEINGIVYDNLKQAIDDVVNAPKNAGSSVARHFSQLAEDLRNAVDQSISPQNPAASPWAIAREKAGTGLQFKEGLEDGAKAFSKATHPDQQAADIARMPYVQRHGYDEGARGAVRDIMGNASTKFGPNGDAAAMKTLSSDYGRQRVANIAGQQNADDLAMRINAEQRFAETEQEVLRNSKTATRMAAQKEFPSPVNRMEDLPQGFQHAVIRLGNRLVNAFRAGKLNEQNTAIAVDAAKMLIAQGASRDQVARGLMHYAQSKGQNAQLQRALGSAIEAIARGSSPSVVDAASTRTPRARREQ